MKDVKKLVLAALFLALGMVLPFLTGQIPQVGGMLCPMHIPVLLCGFVCGWPWGLAVGAVLPVLRSLLFGMPPMLPTAAAMAFELAAYGALAGVAYRWLKGCKGGVYAALLLAMLGGRAVWGVASFVIYSLMGRAFGWQVFLAGAFINAWPGIVLHLILIPPIVLALKKAKLTSVGA